MIEENDWRLLNETDYLKDKYLNPTDGEEIARSGMSLHELQFYPVNK